MGFQSLNNWLLEQTVKGHLPRPARGKYPVDNKVRDHYGCVMMETKIPNWEEFHTAGIEEDDVFVKPLDQSYGLEEKPHVTILFGIHEDEIDSETIKEVIKANMKPLTVMVDEVDVFEGPEYDVVKYNIPISDQLQGYHDLFKKFPNTQTFPDYKPHMTIGYVRSGEGKKYKRKLREPFEVTFTDGVYSYHDDPENPENFTRKVYNLEDKGKVKRDPDG